MLEEYVKCKCFDVVNAKLQYETAKKGFLEDVEIYKKSEPHVSCLTESAARLNELYTRYEELRFNTHQLAWELGYQKIWEEIVDPS